MTLSQVLSLACRLDVTVRFIPQPHVLGALGIEVYKDGQRVENGAVTAELLADPIGDEFAARQVYKAIDALFGGRIP